MSNKEYMIPDFVEEPKTKNEGMEFEEIPFDPYDSKNGVKVSKAEVKDVNIEDEKNQNICKTAIEFVQSLGEGILG